MKRSVLLLIGVFGLLAMPFIGYAEDGKLEFSGDLRGRYEGFRFSEDESGTKKASRSRLRYRLRLNLNATINDHVAAAVQVTTGDQDNRSGNQTLGSPVDFAPSEFDLRRAYISIYPFKGGKLPGSREGMWTFEFGRVPNPYIWKHGPDKMVWDSDIALAGVSTEFEIMATKSVEVFAATGYYAIAENGGAEDPFMVPVQAGIVAGAGSNVSFGGRATYYLYDRLDAAFIERAAEDGNIPDGLTGDEEGGKMQVIEGQAFIGLSGSEAWPVTAFGGASLNTSAVVSESEPEVGKAADAFNAGLDVGSKNKAVRVGVAAVYIEANALVSMFIDSDYLDGVTNRKGIITYVQRRILKSTDIGATVFLSDAIDESLVASVEGSERLRLQLDLVVKF